MLHSLDGELDVAEFGEAGVGRTSLIPISARLRSEDRTRAIVDVHWLGYYIDWDSFYDLQAGGTRGFPAARLSRFRELSNVIAASTTSWCR